VNGAPRIVGHTRNMQCDAITRHENNAIRKHLQRRICIFHAGVIQCTTNLSASGAVQENDVIVMTCSITYSGNWAPVMRWTDSVIRRNFTDDDITLTTDNLTVTSQLTVTASANLHGSQIVCVTYFDAQSSNSLPTSATNIPSYRNVWTSPKLNVLLRCKYHLLILHPHYVGDIEFCDICLIQCQSHILVYLCLGILTHSCNVKRFNQQDYAI